MSDLLQEMLDAAGGMDRWNTIKEVRVKGEMGGMILDIKSDFDPNPTRTSTQRTREAHLITEPYLDSETRGVLTPYSVRIESADGSQIKKERQDPRSKFLRYPGKFRRFFWWDSLDVLYFAGYSIWNYFVTPFFFTLSGRSNRGDRSLD